MAATKPKTIDAYIAVFPETTQRALKKVRSVITEVVPEAEEAISYGIPVFNMNGKYLVYFSGNKKHIGIYPVPNDLSIEKELSKYKTSGKGALQLPLDKPVPVTLLKKILKLLIKKNKEKPVSKGPR
jgi:uncharacterized protein YdhG (YjbR/CyaY superfamily)